MRTYDIINAGKRNRFTVNGRVVSNSGRHVQMQNLPQNHLKDLDSARNLLMDGDLDTLTLCYGSLPMVLSELIRTAFIAKKNHTFAVADFSAIEARVIAWLAGEKWVLDVFRTHGKIYEASAAQMFHIPIEEVTKDQRSRGKVATLALGFQGGVSALTRMDAAGAIPDSEKQGIVDLWRKTNPNIKNLWYSYGKAAIKAVKENVIVTLPHGVKLIGAKSMLFIELPSGRRLAYVRPRIIEGKYGEALQYWGTNQETKKWGLVDTYGGKLTENIVQAVARDCLAETLLRLDACGYEVCLHVHDEVIVEVPIDKAEEQLKNICEIMGTEIIWAKGLPLNAAGYITKYYKKD